MRGRVRCQKRPFSTMSLQHNKKKKTYIFNLSTTKISEKVYRAKALTVVCYETHST